MEGFWHCCCRRFISIVEFFAERKLRLGDAVKNHVRLKEKVRDLAKSQDKYQLLTEGLR